MRKWFAPAGVCVGVAAALGLMAFGITEEVPLANLEGTVVYAETGKPVPNAEIHVEAPGFNFHTVVKAGKDGTFTVHNVPQSVIYVRGLAPGYDAEQEYFLTEKEKSVRVALKWQGDQLNVSLNQRVFTPDEKPEIVLNGLTRLHSVSLKLFKFDDKKIYEERNSYELARNIAYGRYPGDSNNEPEPTPFYTDDHELTSRDVQGHFAETVKLPELSEGLYILRTEVDNVRVHRWINVSRLGLVAKVSPKGLIAYVTDIDSGQPVQGVDIVLHGENVESALGKTDSEGIVNYDHNPRQSGSFVLSAMQGDSKAFAMFYWYPDSDGHASAVHIETDRTIYRPGDTVRFKGFVRVPTQDGYRLPTFSTVEVTISDPSETELKTETCRLTSLGGFDASFKTLAELTGSYHIQVKIDGQYFDKYVPIMSYRKSEFKITVSPERPYYIIGQPAKFVVKATYYTGEPVVGMKISAWTSRAKQWRWSPFDEDDSEYWDYGDGTYGSEYINDYSANTDENGTAVFTVPTAMPKSLSEWETDTDLVYTLNVEASDASGRYFSGDGKVDVVRGDVDLEIAFDDYIVTPGNPTELKIRAKDYATGKPSAARTVHIDFGQDVWEKYKSHRESRKTLTVRLDENGEASVPLTPATSGDYYVVATLQDNGGRTVKAEEYVWSYSYGGSFGGPPPKMQLVLDKRQYNVGDTVNAIVRTDKPGGAALVTVEADGVLWKKVVPLKSEATEVSIPVEKRFRPNVSVAVAYVRQKSFSSTSKSLSVDLAADTLDVSVTPSEKELLPGGTVKYVVTTRDSHGNPVPADVAFTVVDEAVYAIREDTSDPVKSFFPRRWSSVSTVYSFSDFYLDGDDKTGVELQVRRDFRDTAYWEPYLETGKDGKASVEVKLPDNLTSWRATATAVSADAQSGKGKTNVVARKPIMVRLSTPAFMVQDESQTIGATVMNETDQSQTVRVRAEVTGLDVAGSTSSTLTIDARASKKVQWAVTAKTPGQAKMLVSAIAGGAGMNDALEKSFEVKTNGPTYTKYTAGDTTGSATFSVDVDPAARAGSLEVSMTPTFMGSVVGSLDGLVDYPYGCVEQTMDRFMPAIVVRRYLRSAGISRPDLDRKIQDVSQKSQARLQSMQHSDGGFGWWVYDKSDPEMTALVLEGLYQAEKAGADVNVQMRDRAIVWAKDFMKNVRPKYLWRDDSVRLAYAMSLQGVDASEWWLALPQHPEKDDDVAELARTVMAIEAAKGKVPPEAKAIEEAAYKRLVSLAEVGDTTASWNAKWWNEPTAIALQAIVKADPKSDLIPKTLRFLANRRQGRGWWSTRETAQVVLAAVEYFDAVHETGSNVIVTLTDSKGAPHEFHFSASDPSDQQTFILPISMLKKGANQFKLDVFGSGRIYYSTKLVQSVYDPSPQPTTFGKGLSIKREYFRMEAQRLEDGTMRLLPSQKPVMSAKNGEVLHCRLTITTDSDREFVLIDDPAFSNSRFVDEGDIDEYEWSYWWSDQSYFDDHTAIFMRYLHEGENVIEYPVRAEATGTSFALPATVSLMYQPDIRATTGTTKLEVKQ